MESIKQIEFKNSFDGTEIISMLDEKGVRINEDLLKNTYLSEAMKNQLILSNFPEVVENPKTELDLFYSKYYWMSNFIQRYKQLFGEDVCLDQQLFKLIEEGEYSDLEIDWNFVEEIDNEIKQII